MVSWLIVVKNGEWAVILVNDDASWVIELLPSYMDYIMVNDHVKWVMIKPWKWVMIHAVISTRQEAASSIKRSSLTSNWRVFPPYKSYNPQALLPYESRNNNKKESPPSLKLTAKA